MPLAGKGPCSSDLRELRRSFAGICDAGVTNLHIYFVEDAAKAW